MGELSKALMTSLVVGLFILAAVAAGVPCFGQGYLVHIYTENDGLLSSQVQDLAQDPAGRMWFATRRGVSMYDGFTWRSWTRHEGLSGTTAENLAVDDRGVVWVLVSDPGLKVNIIHDGRVTVLPAPDIPDSGERTEAFAAGMVREGPAVAFSAGDRGLFLYDSGSWRRFSPADGLSGDRVHDILYDDGSFLVATNGGLTRIRNGVADNRLNDLYPLFRRGVRGLGRAKDFEPDRIWVCGPDWIGILDGEALRILRDEAALVTGGTSLRLHLAPDGHGGCFLGGWGLFVHMAGNGELVKLGVENGLVGDSATAIVLDRERNVWASGIRGVSKIGGLRFLNYRKIHGLFGDEVTAIAEVEPGRLIFGHNSGLSLMDDDGRCTVLPFKPPGSAIAADSRVLDIQADSVKTIWIADSENGLGFLRHGETVRWFDDGSGIGRRVRTFFIDAAGIFWVSTGPEIFTLREGRFRIVETPEIPQLQIRKIFPGPDGSIDLSTWSSGILRQNGREWKRIFHPAKSAANNVTAVLRDSRGRTWAGTDAGIFVVADGFLADVEEESLKVNRPVYLIMEDHKRRLWFGTDNGVIRWDEERNETHFYTTRNGLAGQEINRSAGLVAGDGRIWLGTNSGVSCFREEYDTPKEVIPPPLVAVTEISVKGRRMPNGSPVQVKYYDNDIEFHFTAPSFIDERNVLFKTRLGGFETRWSEPFRSIDPKVRYTNLKAGSYRLEVQAANAIGVWSPTAVSPEILIGRAFWMTTWFVLFVVAALAGLAFGAVLLITARRYANRLERDVEERTNQLRTSLSEKNVLLKEIHHRVKNNLQVISSLLFLQSKTIRNSKDQAVFQDGMNRIRTMALVHETLYGSGNLAAVPADGYFNAIVGQLKSAYGVESGPVSIEVRAPNIVMTVETAVPCGLIVNELVSNAIKHAFPTGGPGRIEVVMETNPEEGPDSRSYRLVIRDNGAGLTEQFNFVNAETLGLRLVRNLAVQMGGTVEVERRDGTAFIIRF